MSKKRLRYVLKAECSHCGRWGTVDDQTFVCSACGERHEVTQTQLNQRNADMALWMTSAAGRRAQ